MWNNGCKYQWLNEANPLSSGKGGKGTDGTGTLRTTPWKAGMKGPWEITKRLTVWTGLFLEIACLLGCPRLQGKTQSCVIPSPPPCTDPDTAKFVSVPRA